MLVTFSKANKIFSILFSSSLLCNLPNLILAKFFTHSKYETVTPPALAYKSGIITFLFLKIDQLHMLLVH